MSSDMVLVYYKTFQSEEGKPNVSKVRTIIKHDGRYMIFNIFVAVCISLLRVPFILKRISKVRQMDTYIDRLSKTRTRTKR